MHLKSTDPEAKKVSVILVDGKPVKFPVEVDTDEGWCMASVPVPPARLDEVLYPDPDQDNPLETGDVPWKLVKLTGKVEVLFKEKEND